MENKKKHSSAPTDSMTTSKALRHNVVIALQDLHLWTIFLWTLHIVIKGLLDYHRSLLRFNNDSQLQVKSIIQTNYYQNNSDARGHQTSNSSFVVWRLQRNNWSALEFINLVAYENHFAIHWGHQLSWLLGSNLSTTLWSFAVFSARWLENNLNTKEK